MPREEDALDVVVGLHLGVMIVLHDPIRKEDADETGGVALAELDPLSVTVPQVYKSAEAESVGLQRCFGRATLKHLGVK